jgi:hypothetical protein
MFIYNKSNPGYIVSHTYIYRAKRENNRERNRKRTRWCWITANSDHYDSLFGTLQKALPDFSVKSRTIDDFPIACGNISIIIAVVSVTTNISFLSHVLSVVSALISRIMIENSNKHVLQPRTNIPIGRIPTNSNEI